MEAVNPRSCLKIIGRCFAKNLRVKDPWPLIPLWGVGTANSQIVSTRLILKQALKSVC